MKTGIALLLAFQCSAAVSAAGGEEGVPQSGRPAGAGSTPAASTISELRSLEEKIIAAAAKALPAVVFIDGGSGVLISSDGYIITNNHVIEGKVRASRRRSDASRPVEFNVRRSGGRRFRAVVVGRDAAGDIALLKALETGPFPYLELVESESLRPGQWVLAMGNPFLLSENSFDLFSGPGDYSPSVSLGVVSALHRSSDMYPDAIQIDVAVNPGSSGGPLLTTDGQVVGINGKIQTRFTVEVNSGVGYAVPSSQIRRFLTPLKRARGGVVRRGNLQGLAIKRQSGPETGLEVERVRTGSPGESAGFRAGDRIVAFEGQPVWSYRRFESLLATYPVGSPVTLRVLRSGEQRDLAATLDPDGKGYLGVKVDNAPGGGVQIRELVEEGPAAAFGLKVGDIISRVNGKTVPGKVELGEAIGSLYAGDTVTVEYLRGGQPEKLKVRLDAHQEEE